MAGRKQKEFGELTSADIAGASEIVKTTEIVYGDKKAEVTYTVLKWWDKNRCVSEATEYFVDDKGTLRTRFHLEVYYEEALKVILRAAPFPINRIGIRNLPIEIGRQLETLVPNPIDIQAEVAAVKKE